MIFAFLAIVLSLYLKLNHFELALIVLTSTIVLVMELFNTVVEAFVDLVSPEIQPQAKIVKDAAAAGVLISSLGALFIGAIIFLPKIPGL
jgi:undecaprenol kinase/diacylglycerol kinase (ATP)